MLKVINNDIKKLCDKLIIIISPCALVNMLKHLENNTPIPLNIFTPLFKKIIIPLICVDISALNANNLINNLLGKVCLLLCL